MLVKSIRPQWPGREPGLLKLYQLYRSVQPTTVQSIITYVTTDHKNNVSHFFSSLLFYYVTQYSYFLIKYQGIQFINQVSSFSLHV